MTAEAEVVKLLSSIHPRNWPTPFKERLAERLRRQGGYTDNRTSGDIEVVIAGLPTPRFVERVGVVLKRVQVNKVTHRIRFEDETESQVTIVIEPKESQ